MAFIFCINFHNQFLLCFGIEIKILLHKDTKIHRDKSTVFLGLCCFTVCSSLLQFLFIVAISLLLLNRCQQHVSRGKTKYMPPPPPPPKFFFPRIRFSPSPQKEKKKPPYFLYDLLKLARFIYIFLLLLPPYS